MTEGLIIFALCALTLIGATLPLLYDRYRKPPSAEAQNDTSADTPKRN